MLVKRTMSKNVVCVSVPGNRDKVLDLMRKEKKAVLPVVKEDTDILVGLVTRSDLINNPDEERVTSPTNISVSSLTTGSTAFFSFLIKSKTLSLFPGTETLTTFLDIVLLTNI